MLFLRERSAHAQWVISVQCRLSSQAPPDRNTCSPRLIKEVGPFRPRSPYQPCSCRWSEGGASCFKCKGGSFLLGRICVQTCPKTMAHVSAARYASSAVKSLRRRRVCALQSFGTMSPSVHTGRFRAGRYCADAATVCTAGTNPHGDRCKCSKACKSCEWRLGNNPGQFWCQTCNHPWVADDEGVCVR